MIIKSIKLIFGLLAVVTLLSFDQVNNEGDYASMQDKHSRTFNSIVLKQTTTITENHITIVKYEYNNENLITKVNHSGGVYSILEYDDSDRIIKMESFNSQGLYHYFTFQYDGNSTTRISHQYNKKNEAWEGDNLKTVFYYDAKNNCERIDYYTRNESGDWEKSTNSIKCTWLKGNLTELKHYTGDELKMTETFQYDDKLNPEKELNFMISPWTKSKNNIVSVTSRHSDDTESIISYRYTYNKYGYPGEKKWESGGETITENFEYHIEYSSF